MKLARHTRRLYDSAPHLHETLTHITKVGVDFLELEATVAYPEGGGQEADFGWIEAAGIGRLRFMQVKKMYGHPSGLPDFPDIQVGGVIWHFITPEDLPRIQAMREGMPVRIAIDIERRARLSLSHTASHLLYLAVARHRPDAIASTLGCHIRVDGARFDFAVENRFTPEEIVLIEETANGYIRRDARIQLSAHPEVPDARTWHCEGQAIPCGGTHIDSAGAIGPMTIRRKRLGASKERLSCEFPKARPLAHLFAGASPRAEE